MMLLFMMGQVRLPLHALIKCTSVAAQQRAFQNAPLAEMTTQKDFDRAIHTNQFIVAYFYTGDEETRREESEKVKQMLTDLFKTEKADFRAAGVKFIAVRSDHSRTRNLLKCYKLSVDSDYLLFFDHHRLLLQQMVDKDFSQEKFDAFIAKIRLDDLVDRALNDQQKEEEHERLRKEVFCNNGSCGRYCGGRKCYWREGYDWQFPYSGYYYGPYWPSYWSQGQPAFGYSQPV